MPLSRCDRLSSSTNVTIKATGVRMARPRVKGCSAGGFHLRGSLPVFRLKRFLNFEVAFSNELGKLEWWAVPVPNAVIVIGVPEKRQRNQRRPN